MDYHDAADFLFGRRRYPPRPGVETTAALLERVGDPHEDLTCVQVAGSNGKGTTARMVEQILAEAGLTVGLYTSPHLDDVRERIRVDGRPIAKRSVAAFVEDVEPYATEAAATGEDPPTFFETLTAMALWEFDRQDVDVAVLEVGIGGRYDATSVVDPVASAVTSVTLEHTQYLGDTIEEIARDKAQVVPEDGPLLTATGGDALETIREVAGDRVLTVGSDDDADVRVEYRGPVGHAEAEVAVVHPDLHVETRIPTLGAHQARNAGVAVGLARTVADLDRETVARGLRNAHWPGRFEVMGTEPLVVLDGAHNPGACEALAETLSAFDYADLHLVFGAMVDKDHDEMAAVLPDPATVAVGRPTVDRAESDDVLARVFENAGVDPDRIRRETSVTDAVEATLREADPEDAVVVTGSLYTVGEARDRWTRRYVETDPDDAADAAETLRSADVRDPDDPGTAGDLVHRVVRTRLGPRTAQEVRSAALSVGGSCAVAAVADAEEARDVVVAGTESQFRRLVERLDDRPNGLDSVSSDLARAVGIGPDDEVGPRSAAPAGPRSVDGGAGRNRAWPWDDGPTVMGILNVTPDSFHDGGEYDTVEEARRRAERMVERGVGILDVGGESTRPGAEPVPVEEEIDRVVPVIEAIADLGATVSVDTRKAAVAEAAVGAGADVINDVSGLADPEMRFVAAETGAGLVVMHSVDAPVVPDHEVTYDDVVEDVMAHLRERVLLAERAGVPRDRILVDPGIGFGKSAAENFELLDRLGEFEALGCPVMVGHSHKSMFELIGRGAEERLAPTVAGTALAADRGADVIRVHDADENVAAVKTALATVDPDRFS